MHVLIYAQILAKRVYLTKFTLNRVYPLLTNYIILNKNGRSVYIKIQCADLVPCGLSIFSFKEFFDQIANQFC